MRRNYYRQDKNTHLAQDIARQFSLARPFLGYHLLKTVFDNVFDAMFGRLTFDISTTSILHTTRERLGHGARFFSIIEVLSEGSMKLTLQANNTRALCTP